MHRRFSKLQELEDTSQLTEQPEIQVQDKLEIQVQVHLEMQVQDVTKFQISSFHKKEFQQQKKLKKHIIRNYLKGFLDDCANKTIANN